VTYSLGRLVHHDPKSLTYAHGVLPKSAIQSVKWTRRVPHFDQGNVGSCSGNAPAGLIVTDALGYTGVTQVTITDQAAARTKGVFTPGIYTVDETFSVMCYELNTLIDTFPGSYPPDDTGSSGLAAAKTLVLLGLADVYTHGFSMDALDSALQKGPVMAGTDWLESMFEPDANGVINVDQTSKVAGGHEYVISELDLENSRYGIDNSWGDGWGLRGRAYIPRASMAWLLSQQGDITVPHLVGAPAPTPPAPPAPADADHVLASAMRTWLSAKGI
jgi:hypothetical protein